MPKIRFSGLQFAAEHQKRAGDFRCGGHGQTQRNKIHCFPYCRLAIHHTVCNAKRTENVVMHPYYRALAPHIQKTLYHVFFGRFIQVGGRFVQKHHIGGDYERSGAKTCCFPGFVRTHNQQKTVFGDVKPDAGKEFRNGGIRRPASAYKRINPEQFLQSYLFRRFAVIASVSPARSNIYPNTDCVGTSIPGTGVAVGVPGPEIVTI
jgi:hypothetical protein